MKNSFLYILIILSFLLWYTNTELLLGFSDQLNWWTIGSRAIFALAFSWATVLLIRLFPRPAIIIISGILDGTALLLAMYPWANNGTSIALSAIYFALYGSYIVISAGIYSLKQAESEKKANVEQPENIRERLISERRRIQNRINATKDPEKKQVLLAQKREIEQKIGQTYNKNKVI